MATEYSDDPNRIAPYLNPDYWGQDLTNTSERWPTDEPSDDDRQFAAGCLKNYVKCGMNKNPLNTIGHGESFSAEEHLPGTILMSFAERLTVRSKRQVQLPMQAFVGVPTPPGRSVEDGDLKLERYGYRYVAQPIVNVIVHPNNGDKPNVLLITEEKLITIPANTYAAELRPGVCNFTIGKTYNFASRVDESLTRVSELYVCMFGCARGKKTGKSKA